VRYDGIRCVRSAAPSATSTRLPPFRPLSESALLDLDDDALIQYMRRARAAGHGSAALALAVMVYGHWANVQRRVALKVPASYVEDLTGDIIADAIASAFDGTSVGQFRAWLRTITDRAIADFFRRGAGRIKTDELSAAGEPAAPSAEGLVEVHDAIERVMSDLREDHQRVIEIFVFEGRPAADAATVVPGMTEANVHQIASRFRRALAHELDAGGDTGSG
jgi:DNA-directed RNA polymerase specialized sigma24 family protein